MSHEPIDGVAPVTRPGNRLPRAVDERQLHHGVEHRGQIGHHFAAPVARDLVDELLAEAGGPSRVGRRHNPALRRPQFGIPSIRPSVFPGSLRTTMDQEHDRIFS